MAGMWDNSQIRQEYKHPRTGPQKVQDQIGRFSYSTKNNFLSKNDLAPLGKRLLNDNEPMDIPADRSQQ